MRKFLVTVERKNTLLTRRNNLQNQAQGGGAISCKRLGVREGRRDKRHAVEERQRLIIANDYIQSGV